MKGNKIEIEIRAKHIQYLMGLYRDVEKNLHEWKLSIDELVEMNLKEIYEIVGV